MERRVLTYRVIRRVDEEESAKCLCTNLGGRGSVRAGEAIAAQQELRPPKENLGQGIWEGEARSEPAEAIAAEQELRPRKMKIKTAVPGPVFRRAPSEPSEAVAARQEPRPPKHARPHGNREGEPRPPGITQGRLEVRSDSQTLGATTMSITEVRKPRPRRLLEGFPPDTRIIVAGVTWKTRSVLPGGSRRGELPRRIRRKRY